MFPRVADELSSMSARGRCDAGGVVELRWAPL
jgi:hypothetical protein